MRAAIAMYPLFEHAIRGQRRHTVQEHLPIIARLMAGFSKVAADNPLATRREGYTAERLATVDDENPWIGFPYPRFMNSNAFIDQSAALVMTSVGQAMELGIRDGCCFGPVLVMDGAINEEAYNSNSGFNPRTAIGQRSDGTVLFVCIDGRQAGSLGGTYKDIIDIMTEYGAVNACNLDGGSSTVMLYKDTCGKMGEKDEVHMINNYSLLQEEPRRMPTFFMVRPGSED